MDDPLRMSCGQAFGDMPGDPDRLAVPELASTIKVLLQRMTMDIFHDKVRQSCVFTDGVNRDDVVMIKGSDRSRFAKESFAGFVVSGQFRRQNFDGDLTLGP